VGSAGSSDPRLLILGLRPDGTLDPSFPVYRGRGVERWEPRVTAAPDGTLTVSGGGALLRLSANGAPLGETSAGMITSLAARSDGSVLALGNAPTTLWLDRYVDGQLDAGFHREYNIGSAWTDLDVGPGDAITAIGAPNLVAHLAADGSLQGTSTLSGEPQAIVRAGDQVAIVGGTYQPFVALPGGETRSPVIGRQSYFSTGALLPDGRVLAAGETFAAGDFVAIARFLPASSSSGDGTGGAADPPPAGAVDPPPASDATPAPAAPTNTTAPATLPPARPAAKLRLVKRSLRGCRAVRLTSPRAGTVRLAVSHGKRTVLKRTIRLRRAGSADVRLCGTPRQISVKATLGSLRATASWPAAKR
jgi:hypothetical protein